ncbi:MAG: hypothetical protein QXX35_01795 [Desulfurococcaceae archaeon]|uniref:Uncharacterized protein n=1 Tax=Staphylothermus marinus TaxID=2280 RepID=A0A7C4DAU9_STAMA
MNGRLYGVLLIFIAIALALLYLIGLVIIPDYKVFNKSFSEILIKYTILVLMLLISGVIGYIGYLIATSPVPKPVEEIIKEYREQTR